MPRLELVNGISLFYHDEGLGGEPIVLIHGFPLTSDMYQPQRAALSASFRVLTPDLRGMGRSDAPAEGYSMDTYADDIVALMDDRGVGQAIVGGMSMGGYVLFALLRRHPERVKGIILIDTQPKADSDETKAKRRAMIEKTLAEGPVAATTATIENMLTERTRTEQPDLARFIADMVTDAPVEGIVGAIEAMMARPDSTPLLAQIDVPTLIIVGSEDTITPPAVAEEMQRAIKGAQLVVIDGAAHASNLERPDEVNRAIMDWATKVA